MHLVSDSRGRGAHCLGNMELWRQRRRVWLGLVVWCDVSFCGVFEKCERCGLCEECERYELCREYERYESWKKCERYS